jgi:hypothetical protein
MVRDFIPLADVIAVQCAAKNISGNESKLLWVHSNDADQGAVQASNQPAFPPFLTYQNG